MKKFAPPTKSLEKFRGIYFQLGIIIASGLTLVAFEWTTPVYISELPVPKITIDEDMVLPPITYPNIKKPEVKIEQKKVNPLDFNIVKDIVEPVNPSVEPVKDPTPEFNPEEWKEVETIEEDIPIIGAGIGVMPKFKEGDAAIFKYLLENLKYPKMAIENQIQGTVHLRFVVGKNGKIRDIEILRGINKLLDDEAVRVIKEMPDWSPGKQHGKPVSVYYTLPIRFTLK